MSTWTTTPDRRRMETGWIYTDIARSVLGPTEDYEALSDESVRLLESLGGVMLSVVDALRYRDERAAYQADGRADECPEQDPDLSVDDVELIASMADKILRSAIARGAGPSLARIDQGPGPRTPRAVA